MLLVCYVVLCPFFFAESVVFVGYCAMVLRLCYNLVTCLLHKGIEFVAYCAYTIRVGINHLIGARGKMGGTTETQDIAEARAAVERARGDLRQCRGQWAVSLARAILADAQRRLATIEAASAERIV